MFVDRATIDVRAGKGGDGRISFLRAKFKPLGGPDGGDGGDGGTVYVVPVTNLNSLDRIARSPTFVAEDGQPGGSQLCKGRRGQDLTIPMPLGTMIYNEAGELICDLTELDQKVPLARGGIGGKGNKRFASAVRQVPRIATRGEAGEGGKFRLELKLIAQIGLLGMPNAGKSTFLRATTRATPDVAPYPFTTLTPHLGVARLNLDEELILADIPGLIEGASEGLGLGDEFLRHIERTRVLLHLVDVAARPELGAPGPAEAWRIIRKEVEAYSPALAAKPTIIGLNKCELVSPEELEERKKELEALSGREVMLISGATGEGIKALLWRLHKIVRAVEAKEREARAAQAAASAKPDLAKAEDAGQAEDQ